MRILYHHRTLGDGAEGIHVSEMVNAFRKLGHEVSVLGPAVSDKSSDRARFMLFSLLKRSVRGPLYELLEIFYNPYGYYTVNKAIASFKPDLIYDRYITFNYACIAAGRKNNIPVFLEVNAPLALERRKEADETLYFKAFASTLERLICQQADKTIVVSSPLKDYLVSIGVPADNIFVLPNGVNPEIFSQKKEPANLRQKLGVLPNDLIIGFVGILRPWHGIDLLLDMLLLVRKNFPNAVLMLVGDGPIRKDIETLAKTLGLDKSVIITGRVSHEQVGDYLAMFDVAVSPKATFYASPMKIPEYMAQGIPVVAPDMPNIRDLIVHRENGLLFSPNSPQALAESVNLLLTDHLLRNTLKDAAKQETVTRLNWISNAKKVIDQCYKPRITRDHSTS